MVAVTHFPSFTGTVSMQNVPWNNAQCKPKTMWSISDSISLSGRSTSGHCLLRCILGTHPLKMSLLSSSLLEWNNDQHSQLLSQNFQYVGSSLPLWMEASFPMNFPTHGLDISGNNWSEVLKADFSVWCISYPDLDRPPLYHDQTWYILGL